VAINSAIAVREGAASCPDGCRRFDFPALSILLVAAYTQSMDTSRPRQQHEAETDAERTARLAREAAMIAEAEADVAAGRVVDFADVKAWVESWGTPSELPRPRPRR
jgi:predicted transcriptional regulator